MRKRIQEFVSSCLAHAPSRDAVEAEALALYAWQRDRNPGYQAFCGDVEPTVIEDIPSVPVALFRDLPWCCFPIERARYAFHTSGTTTGNPGVHRLMDTETYDLASEGWFRVCLPDAPELASSLVPSPAQAPRSSLSHMVGLLWPRAHYACGEGDTVLASQAWDWLRAATEPVFIATTALSLATLLEHPGRCRLPPGSMLMTTGGFKGRHLQVEPEALLKHAVARLGEVAVLGEYGMTELSSQLWTRPRFPGDERPPDPRGPFYPPPWLVPITVDPLHGRPLPHGRPGQVRFVDLANDHSVLAIETMDQGTLLPDGGLLLHGRLPGAEVRGCSLGVEEALRAARSFR